MRSIRAEKPFVNQKKIARILDLDPKELLAEGVLAYLHKELRLTEEDLADLRERYNVLSPHELEEQIRQGVIPPHPAWEDLIEWENLEAYKQKLQSLLTELHAPL
jgi:hypothetical protein